MSDTVEKNRDIAGGVLFGVSAAWVQAIVAVMVNVVQIPLLYRCLARDALGAWMIFTSIGIFLLVWDLGLGATFSRSMAYFRGARGAMRNGEWGMGRTDEHSLRNPHSEIRIGQPPCPGPPGPWAGDMLRTVSLSFWLLAAVLYVVGLFVGRIYLGRLEFDATPFETVWLAWTIYAFGCAVNLGSATPFHCLNGMGDVGIEQCLQTACNLLALLANVIILLAGGGIVALSVVFVARGFAARAAAWVMLKRRHAWLFKSERRPGTEDERPMLHRQWSIVLRHWSILRVLRGDCLRIFVTRFGAFLILQTSGLVIAQFLTPRRVPDFMAMWMIVQLGMMGGMAIGQAATPYAAAAHAAGENPRLLRLHRHAARAALFLISLWCVGLLVWARELMALWTGPGHFLGYAVLAPMVITGVMEVHHSVNANFVWSSGRWPFAPWAIAAGILNLGLGIWWVRLWGEMGMACATCVAQLLTNNWFAVYYALRRLQVPGLQYLRQVVLPVAGMISCAALVAVAAKVGLGRLTMNEEPWPSVLGPRSLVASCSIRGVPLNDVAAFCVGGIAAVMCAFALYWRFGMDAEARRALRFALLRLPPRTRGDWR